MTGRHAQLGAIRTFRSLVKYLRDEMGWPIGADSFEDLTFDYSAEELGIDAKNAAKIEEIKRLRPLASGQPWGIFFVKFEPKRLPVVALRRILSQVVLKKRATAKAAELAAWAADDLLFVSNYGEGDARHISFAHFSTAEGGADLPTLKVLGWDNLDTPLHLDDVAEHMTRDLAWPEDENDAKAWRKAWRGAFTLGHREVITTSRDLSIRLAELARAIRDRIATALAIENAKGPLTVLMKAFQSTLVHDLDAAGFADMYAQTIAYGLLSSRIADPKARTADDFAAHMRTNPFLKELMQTFLQVGGRRGKAGGPGIDFDELGVSEVVALLDRANMTAVLRDFGDQNPQEDPVIHFYELFLKEYDANKRMQRGVFYTPRPVVSFIVRSMDDFLRTEFDLADGLADITNWAEFAKRRPEMTLPVGISHNQPFVQILDPATGTGTFLVEAIRLIHETMVTKWKAAGKHDPQILDLWNEYVPLHLLPRLHGYELQMAPYAIAHLKIGLKLYETGYRFGSEERARIYLTNALEPASDMGQHRMAIILPALAQEAQSVNEIKKNQKFTVVLGNPPYSVSSWNNSSWITNLVEDYKRTVRVEESQIQGLSNDYIKFIRLGQKLISDSRAGVMGMITGHGYLGGTQPRDMRNSLSSTFDKSFLLDLHGSIRRSGTDVLDDEPVFQIMTGVAVFVGFSLNRAAQNGSARGITSIGSLVGPTEKKFQILSAATVRVMDCFAGWHTPTPPNYYFSAPTSAGDIVSEYQGFYDLPACFGTGDRHRDKEKYWATGFASQQDDLAISFSLDELAKKMEDLHSSDSFENLQSKYRICTTDQWDYVEAKKFVRNNGWKPYVGEVCYRPFDKRWSVLNKNILTILRRQVMSQISGKKEYIGLVSSRAINDLSFAHCFVVDQPVDKIFISSKTSTNAYVFPLYFAGEGLYGKQRRPNISGAFSNRLAESLEIKDRDKNTGLPSGISPEDILNYIYSLLSCRSYRARYAEFLKADFPRIPVVGSLKLFKELGHIGGQLVALHTLASPMLCDVVTSYEGPREPEVQRVSWLNNTVWLDAGAMSRGKAATSGTIGFHHVAEDVWNFHVGGYQVCEKWLKDRKGRTLTAEDIAHYQKIIAAVAETIRLMDTIDAVIEGHGGWPGAFAATEAAA